MFIFIGEVLVSITPEDVLGTVADAANGGCDVKADAFTVAVASRDLDVYVAGTVDRTEGQTVAVHSAIDIF